MKSDLEALERHCREIGFEFREPAANTLEVPLLEGLVLVFQNLADETETFVGFKDTPWHFHGKLILMLEGANTIELDGCELLTSLKSGAVVVVERFVDSILEDRWVAHKLEPFQLKYLEAGEEIRIRRLP